uniref:Phostensin n=1 Tax=Oncorhynchus tshawytscha TaxID=74940 RepID=A0A8C8MCD5_ONCTS
MSVSSLPEWKQLLLERKRREEEEREKREKEEEDKLASMPAWKRGIIQRRRMKQESFGDKEREDITGLVLKETIIPVGQNSFIRTHGGWRRGREAERAGEMGHEKGNEQEIEVGRERQKEKERGHVKGHDGESGKGRDIEIQIERYRDRSGGRERDRSAGRERDRSRGRERDRSRGRERDRSAGRETSRDTVMEEEQENRDVKMDLKEFMAGGGSVTEIRASEILIIKPLAGNEDSRSGGLKGTGREGDGERGRDAKCNKDGGKDCERQLEREVAWLMMKDKERENLREKDRPRTQVASSEKEDQRYGDTDDSIHNERGVRVSELLSKFGEHPKKFREHPKPPSRSKSSECFIRPGRGREPFCLDDGDRRGEEEHAGFRGVPKRSFSFSDRVICTKENGMEYQPPHQLPHPSPPPSPSPSPSPTHFTIRSLSGGQQVKRGTTITITPRKPVGGAAVEAVSVSSRPLANTSAQSQMPVLTEEGEKGKKRYPTAEEIEVIGGYQNLDKSCLVKTSKASPKGVSVDCRLAYCRLCTINCIDEVSHLVEITPTTRVLQRRGMWVVNQSSLFSVSYRKTSYLTKVQNAFNIASPFRENNWSHSLLETGCFRVPFQTQKSLLEYCN